jgi:sulfide:quinone oxidoreductase
MALKHSAGERVSITLVAPDEAFTFRALSVGQPFALGEPQRIALAEFARSQDIEWRRDALAEVMPTTHAVSLGDGSVLVYDKLIVAIGARRVPAYEHATTFRGQEDVQALHGLVQDVEMGYVKRIAFVVPPGIAWSLPLYELALMTARRAYEMDVDVELTFITPEERPLPVFGAAASADVAAMLGEAGISVYCSTVAEVHKKGTVALRPSGDELYFDRVIALAAVKPIEIKGLATDASGFLPIDSHCRVRGVENVFAAGDGTNFPIKQGGIACQQADVAAEAIARAAGAPVDDSVFRPVMRGQLLTGQKPHFMQSDVSGREGDRSESSEQVLWWPPTKVAGRFLAPYLAPQERELGDGEVELRGYEFVTR